MSTATSAVIAPMATAPVQSNPFPGLRPFHEDEEYLFFGRESQIDAMVNKLTATRFLAVVGTSGSGKSSLVNCGLRPALRGGLMARAGTTWRMAQFRPGSDPVGTMAGALARNDVLFRDYQSGGFTLAEIIDTTLRMSNLGLIDIYEQAKLDEDVNLLVVVDQFEELFRYRQLRDGQQASVSGVSETATAFVNLLLEAKEQTTYPIYVVLTMRSDFLGDCAQFPGLAEAINAGQYLVPRMTRDERRAAITGPVGVGGADISPVLLTRLVNDVGDNPDQLSILQHALNRTWARWQNEGGDKGPLDLAHYEAIGTMAHALDRHAERAYAELDTARKRLICEKIFQALTDTATDRRGVRRPTTLSTLCALAGATVAEVTAVIEVFRKPSGSFLMPPAGEVLEPKTVIDISHESLMRVWQRLNAWADEEAQSAQTYRRLADTAALHAAGKASLWRDPDLQLALDWSAKSQPTETWAARYHAGLATDMDFLDASVALRQIEENQKELARQAELRRQQELAEAAGKLAREQARRAKIATIGVIVAVLMAAFAGWKWFEASRAEKEADVRGEEASRAEKKANLQRDLAVFSIEAAKSITGPISGQLRRLADTARKAVDSKSPLDKQFAYLDIADYYVAAFDQTDARLTLKKVDEYIKQAPLSDNSDRSLRTRYYEISGDIEGNIPGNMYYSRAFGIIDGADEAEPDVAETRARLLRKMADLNRAVGDIAAANRQLSLAQLILDRHAEPWALHESALLAATRADVFVQQGSLNEASLQYAQAVDFLHEAHEADPRDNAISLELATTLQKQGDVQRHLGDAHALTTYITTLGLLDKIVADDPTSFTALSAIDLTRHGIRLLDAVTEANASIAQKRNDVRARIDSDFGAGLGKFRFGMTIFEANQVLHRPFAIQNGASELPSAPEFRTADIRYFFKYFADEPDLRPFPFPACLLNPGYTVLFFHDNHLFRIELRLFKEKFESCKEGSSILEKFAEQYGLTTTGSPEAARFRYETQRVAVMGFIDPIAVYFQFDQR